ncbi:MAG TPA: 2-amino-4-hydroxy-6-hydroxymethyldihydropteridine diphosphokinase [Nitrospiria bacterium]|nr:2-amino-4-hydroxy-6-hydroxymethyldihydropteridine diphosphokinase [Nitrospiria bacterium]
MTEPVIAYIGIGSNMGDRQAYCQEAVRLISRFPKTSLTAVSSLYETAPLERTNQDWFINCVMAIRTTLSPRDLLQACQEVEQFLGRKRTVRFGPRTIDLDILFYGNRTFQESGLTIPHPRAHQRRFVLVPLAEIAPELEHPSLHKTAVELLQGIKDSQEVRRWAPFSLEQKAG